MYDTLTLLSFGDQGWGDELAAGAWLTIKLALTVLPFGLGAGFLLSLGRNSRNNPLAAASNAFSTIFRGLPEILTLIIIYYGIQILLKKIASSLGIQGLEISPFAAGVIALSFVFSAFASEVFLGAIRALPIGQTDAGRALGLKKWQVMVFISLPQIIRLSIPGLSNLWLNLLKETSLVSVIALSDLLRQTSIAVGVTKQPFLFYGIACLLYFLMALISSIALNFIERWSERGVAYSRPNSR